jgi:hypothetical protein
VGALLDEPTAVEHEDHVGGEDCGQPVRDRYGGSAGHEWDERLLDDPFVYRVERRGGFVEDEDFRVFEDDAGDREPLFLAA